MGGSMQVTRRNAFRLVAVGAAALGTSRLVGCGRPAIPPVADVPADLAETVRWIESTSRGDAPDVLAMKLREGLTQERFLAAIAIASTRGLPPMPVGGWLHPAFTVHQIHHATELVTADRRVPLYFLLDAYKHARQVTVGLPVLGRLDATRLPPVAEAPARLRTAVDQGQAADADAAMVSLYRSAPQADVIDTLVRFGTRDVRNIAHQIIYPVEAVRLFQLVGWQYAETVFRGIATGLLDTPSSDPALAHFAANEARIPAIRADWLMGTPDAGATRELITGLRTGGGAEASALVASLLGRGVAPSSIWDGLLMRSCECMLRWYRGGEAAPFAGLHGVTGHNGFRQAYEMLPTPASKLLVLLQAAAHIGTLPDEIPRRGIHEDTSLSIDTIAPSGDRATIDQVFDAVPSDPTLAFRHALAYFASGGTADAFLAERRRVMVEKGNEEHDYKYPLAVDDEVARTDPAWRPQLLATSLLYAASRSAPDFPLLRRVRAFG